MTEDATRVADPARAAEERFEAGASRYADYLETTEGRLRLDLAWTNLLAFLGGGARAGVAGVEAGRALDLGGGTGALALRLAARGWRVEVVDSSAAMLALAAEAARREGLSDRVAFHQHDAARAGELFPPASFDLVACHNVVEYVEDAGAVVGAAGGVTRPGGVVSILARNRAGEVLRAALKSHDLSAADEALIAETARESLYGGPARLFDARTLCGLAAGAALEVAAELGVRVVADYLPAALSGSERDYARLLEFERKLGARPEFAAVARYLQVIARRSQTVVGS